MSEDISAEIFIEELETYQSEEELINYQRYFKFEKGKQSEDDYFIGVKMGIVFQLAKDYRSMSPSNIEKLLESPVHEVRVGAVSIMDWQVRNNKTSKTRRKELFDLYIRRHDRINNWDLVDRSAPRVIGDYLKNKSRGILYELAHSDNIWERRTAIVSTANYIKQGDLDDTFFIAEILLKDDQDLIHKATGWMLRAAGKIDQQRLLSFLDQYAAEMPRTLLRYAMEHLEKEQRDYYRKKMLK